MWGRRGCSRVPTPSGPPIQDRVRQQLLEANDFATLKQAIDARLQSLRPS
jgi:hypothetical protein